VIIPTKFRGHIIGRGGQSIKRLEQDFGAKLHLEGDKNASNNVLIIYGATWDSVKNTEDFVVALLKRLTENETPEETHQVTPVIANALPPGLRRGNENIPGFVASPSANPRIRVKIASAISIGSELATKSTPIQITVPRKDWQTVGRNPKPIGSEKKDAKPKIALKMSAQ
jgi:KH domain